MLKEVKGINIFEILIMVCAWFPIAIACMLGNDVIVIVHKR